MKKLSNLVSYLSLILMATIVVSCDKKNYKGGEASPIINIELLRDLYKGSDLTLIPDVIYNAQHVGGVVISDYVEGNIPSNLLIIQSSRGYRGLRGIAINIGATEAAKYAPGDSVHVNIQNGVLKRINGILQVTGVDASKIQKVATNRSIIMTSASAVAVKNDPNTYESRLVTIYGSNFEPNIGVETLEGVKDLNDGSGDMQLYVSSNAIFKSEFLPYSANVTGILFGSTTGKMQIYPRKKADFVPTSIVVDPNIPLGPTPVVITALMCDPAGTDTNQEYIQFMATQDLDFRKTPFCVITTNNAGASNPNNEAPPRGWATGALRTYKFNITRGTAAKGTFFYVGGYKKINGSSSTDIAGTSNWAASKLYGSDKGDDDIGDITTNLLANSGNAAGVAIFKGTNVDINTIPIDVVIYAGNGTIFSAGPPAVGYAISDNDRYKRYNGATFQPFLNQGNNTGRYFTTITQGSINVLGGVFDVTQNKWTTARASNSLIALTNTSQVSEIETGTKITKLTY
ncbi:DUF5689 domain-containing protein [Pedobacter sp. ASV28]|uniref:DUF5689 domain-containing protein n=1 Tax=Pedobacter sp. ASV28 TaxID=2795123 RepID=UPI0018EC21AC|nr:DUF5689 domain-containing protein [Pedobacter sp. ASV28]